MSNYPFQVSDSGISFKSPNPFPDSNDFDTSFNKVQDSFNSSVKWAVAGSIVLGIVLTIAVVAIVYAIIDCLKKAGNAIPAYAKIATSDTEKASAPLENSSNHMATNFPVIPDLHVEFPTMEKFLSSIARERPVRFSPEEIEGFTNNYSTILGSGGYGVVFKGEFPNGVRVAVKVLTEHSKKKVEEQFMAEVGTIGRTNHVNLVRLFGFCLDQSVVALVYEFMENGSLNKFIFDQSRELEWEKLREIAIGIARGIAYLHEECQQRIIHYDIKSENILLDQNLNPKVADFGLAKLCNRENTQTAVSGRVGTLGYTAPEICNGKYPVTHKCDVYSFGILLFEIIGRRRQFVANFSESRQWLPRWTWDMYKNNELAVMLSLCGIKEEHRAKAERMALVALLCIQYAPDARPLMSDVVKMLEGGMDILQPENPFQYLESTGLYFEMDTESSEDFDTPLPRKYSKKSYANPVHGISEIELAG